MPANHSWHGAVCRAQPRMTSSEHGAWQTWHGRGSLMHGTTHAPMEKALPLIPEPTRRHGTWKRVDSISVHVRNGRIHVMGMVWTQKSPQLLMTDPSSYFPPPSKGQPRSTTLPSSALNSLESRQTSIGRLTIDPGWHGGLLGPALVGLPVKLCDFADRARKCPTSKFELPIHITPNAGTVINILPKCYLFLSQPGRFAPSVGRISAEMAFKTAENPAFHRLRHLRNSHMALPLESTHTHD